MGRSKSSIRKVHINGEEWTWRIQNHHRYHRAEEIRIYSPQKKMTRISADEFMGYPERDSCSEFSMMQSPGEITPGLIKAYIQTNLIPQNDGNPA